MLFYHLFYNFLTNKLNGEKENLCTKNPNTLFDPDLENNER